MMHVNAYQIRLKETEARSVGANKLHTFCIFVELGR